METHFCFKLLLVYFFKSQFHNVTVSIRDEMIGFARQMKEFTLGPFNPSVNIFQWLEVFLYNHIPDNAHQLANGRLAVAVTRMVDRKLTIITSFDSKEDVINVS